MSEAKQSAQFGAMTDEQMVGVFGGDPAFADAVGWFAGYAWECTKQAIYFDTALIQRRVPQYIAGYGWF